MTKAAVGLKDELKNAIPATAFYGVSILLMFVFEELVPSGPCTPGPALLVMLVLPVASFVLLIFNLIQRFRDGEFNKLVILIHLLVFTVFMLLYAQDMF